VQMYKTFRQKVTAFNAEYRNPVVDSTWRFVRRWSIAHALHRGCEALRFAGFAGLWFVVVFLCYTQFGTLMAAALAFDTVALNNTNVTSAANVTFAPTTVMAKGQPLVVGLWLADLGSFMLIFGGKRLANLSRPAADFRVEASVTAIMQECLNIRLYAGRLPVKCSLILFICFFIDAVHYLFRSSVSAILIAQVLYPNDECGRVNTIRAFFSNMILYLFITLISVVAMDAYFDALRAFARGCRHKELQAVPEQTFPPINESQRASLVRRHTQDQHENEVTMDSSL